MDGNKPIITFTSDFGHKDGYTGIVKGVILSICPQALIVDISHDVPPFDLAAAKWVVNNSFPFFPPETVHLAVVDPGVGGNRKNILLDTGREFFVGPDNGIFSSVLDSVSLAYELTEREFFSENISATFQARDIYGPVAAHLARGTPPAKMGRLIDTGSLVRWNSPVYRHEEDSIIGEVVYVDGFGNLISNIPAAVLGKGAMCFLNGTEIGEIGSAYISADMRKPIAFAGSHGNLEIGIREGKAASKLKARVGNRVVIKSQQG